MMVALISAYARIVNWYAAGKKPQVAEVDLEERVHDAQR